MHENVPQYKKTHARTFRLRSKVRAFYIGTHSFSLRDAANDCKIENLR